MAEKKTFKEETLNEVFTTVQMMIHEGLLNIPTDYSVVNALRHSWFKIKDIKGNKDAGYKGAVELCTKESIANCLLKMVTDGLTPAKNQCGFIIRKAGAVYNLDYHQEYQGKIALAKRYSGVINVIAREVYKLDNLVTEISSDGREELIKHEQPFENLGTEIIGGYCIITDSEGYTHMTKMSIAQIKKSWAMGAMKGGGDVHKNFEEEMVKKTVTNRACKPYINSSNDSAILPELPQLEQAEDTTKKLSFEPKTEHRKLEIEADTEEKPTVERPESLPTEQKTEEENPY